ncbi:unnamed protein product [Polarella glacialis]|uniref:Uncharacterized protein n=1 Tax=Polarella glacialis TaxID=89957 RepID=A0A813IE16_POLGL|nr:unnamed protein product [Polarella glacialis]
MRRDSENLWNALEAVCKLLGKELQDAKALRARASAEAPVAVFEASVGVDDGGLGEAAMSLMVQGAALMRACRTGDARSCFETAVLLCPLDLEANFNMGLFFEVSHQPDLMAPWMRRVQQLDPNNYMALVLLGKYEEWLGDFGSALTLYRKATGCDPHPHLAQAQIDQMTGDHKVSLDPFSSWPSCIQEILAELPSWRRGFPPWQENILHPRTDLPKTALLADGVCVWDGAVGEPLLTQLDACAEEMHHFISTNFWLTPGSSVTTAWLAREKLQPETAAELATRHLIPRLLGESCDDFCGVEWWAKMRKESRGQGLHYDQSEADEPAMNCSTCGARQGEEWVHGNPWRPRWSSVLFLTDEGGPTVILEQIHTQQARNDPRCPQRGFVVMPKRGRWVVFRGDLFHGCMPVAHHGGAPRKILVFNMWRSHRPPAGHCNDVQYGKHPALQKILFRPGQLESTLAAESARREPPRIVECTRVDCASTLRHSTSFGCLPFALPAPSESMLKLGTGFYELDWRAAAEALACPRETPAFYEAVD